MSTRSPLHDSRARRASGTTRRISRRRMLRQANRSQPFAPEACALCDQTLCAQCDRAPCACVPLKRARGCLIAWVHVRARRSFWGSRMMSMPPDYALSWSSLPPCSISRSYSWCWVRVISIPPSQAYTLLISLAGRTPALLFCSGQLCRHPAARNRHEVPSAQPLNRPSIPAPLHPRLNPVAPRCSKRRFPR